MGSVTMILLDTCAIIWDALEPSRFSDRILSIIAEADKKNALMVADISMWEIAMLIKKRRLEIDSTAAHLLNLFLQSRSITVQSITPEIAELSVSFGTEMHNDPADRIIAATAIIHSAQLVTADENLRATELLDTIW